MGRFSDNGIEKNLHYVIKNNEFSIVVQLPDAIEEKTFNNLVVEAYLLYDCSPSPKEVLQVRQKPFKYKGIVERGDASKCNLQVSISILSSQHEDMNFILHVKAKDSSSQSIIAEGFSEPVQVISKPDVLRKKREPKKKKRTWNDRITETLERIEAMQRESLAIAKNNAVSQPKTNDSVTLPQNPLDNLVDDSPEPYPSERFETAFYDLVRAYKSMTAEERPSKIRKLVAGASLMDSTVNDMVGCFHQSTKEVSVGGPVCLDNYYLKNDSPNQSIYASDIDLTNLVDSLFSPAFV